MHMQPHEQVLRTLVKYFNQKHYSAFLPPIHRRTPSFANGTGSLSEAMAYQSGHAHGGMGQHSQGNHVPLHSPMASHLGAGAPSASGLDAEAFPPLRHQSIFGDEDRYRTSYIPDSLMDGYLEDYEDILGDIFTPSYDAHGMPVATAGVMGHLGGSSPSRSPNESAATDFLTSADQIWHRLGAILGDTADISDSESVGSIGYLDVASDGEASETGGEDGPQQGRNDWEHLRQVMRPLTEQGLATLS